MQTGQSLASSRWAARHCPWPPVTARSPAAMRVCRAFAGVSLSDTELGDLRLISRNGRAESACPVTRW